MKSLAAARASVGKKRVAWPKRLPLNPRQCFPMAVLADVNEFAGGEVLERVPFRLLL